MPVPQKLMPQKLIDFTQAGLIISLLGLLQGCLPSTHLLDRSRLNVTYVYTVAPDILALQIDTGKVQYGQQEPYQAWPGDQVAQPRPEGDDWVRRGWWYAGSLVGKDRNLLYTFDRYHGTDLNVTWAEQLNSYQISSESDAIYESGQAPIAVYRKTKPTDMAQIGRSTTVWPLRHVLYLKLPNRLKSGATYQIKFQGGNLGSVTFDYQPNRLRSEAVQVSQVGFRPDDPVKVAFLSTWMGNGGSVTYRDRLPFSLIPTGSQEPAFQGTTTLTKKALTNEDARERDYTLAEVNLIDFSAFKTPGQYRVCVEAIGCSFPFAIEAHAWQHAFYISARGFYHQRSGIEIGPPYTTYQRPRAFHPDDGVTVYQSKVSLMEVDQGIGKQDAFAALLATQTDEVVPNAWGGYFDAGDWDRRIQHLEAMRLLLELAELFPDYFKTANLNIPESSNNLPDVIDEALWGLDFFRRLQTSDGGIRGGIESASHPRIGETSWQESHRVMAYTPDIWSSYIYAGTAARAAHWLKGRVPQLSQQYQQSALRAMAYAEKIYASQSSGLPQTVLDERNLAAIELFRLTGDNRWHQLFLQTTAYKDAKKEMYDVGQKDAVFVYLRLQNPEVNQTIRQNALNALLREADMSAALTDRTGFKWTKAHPYHPIAWGVSVGAPKAITLVRAHYLTGRPQYLRAAILASQLPLGANPDNMSFTTGLGQRTPQHPLILDQRIMGWAPPPGITVYGPLDLVQFNDTWIIPLLKNVVFPPIARWPVLETYFDIFRYPAATEFTIMQTIGPSAYTWGYLAARK